MLYDSDAAGREGSAKVARALRSAGVEIEVREYGDLPRGADLTDLYAKLGRDDGALLCTVIQLPPVDIPEVTESTTTPPDDALTDSGNSTRLMQLHGPHLRYIPRWGKWLVWSQREGRWILDDKDVRVRELAKDVGRGVKHEAASEPDHDQAKRLFAFGASSLNARKISAMVDLARGIDGVPLDHERLDADGWLLGVKNGVIDLRTGQLRPAQFLDLITRQCPTRWSEDARAPRWEQATKEWFPDSELRAYVRRLAGAALMGGQRDHVFVIHYGGGGNGKGTFMHAVQQILGPLAVVIHLSLLVQSRIASTIR